MREQPFFVIINSCLLTAASKPEKKSSPVSLPKFATSFDEYIRSQEGDTVELECKVAGNPTPTVTWTIGDKRVENSTVSFEVSTSHMIFLETTNSGRGGTEKNFCHFLKSLKVNAHLISIADAGLYKIYETDGKQFVPRLNLLSFT